MRKAIILIGGAVASILVIALVSIMLFGRTRMAAFAISIGAAHVIVLGIPVFLILHRRNLIRLRRQVQRIVRFRRSAPVTVVATVMIGASNNRASYLAPVS